MARVESGIDSGLSSCGLVQYSWIGDKSRKEVLWLCVVNVNSHGKNPQEGHSPPDPMSQNRAMHPAG